MENGNELVYYKTKKTMNHCNMKKNDVAIFIHFSSFIF